MHPRHLQQVDSTLAFHLMKFASQLYEKKVTHLSIEEYAEAYILARHETLLHQMILHSEAACGVVVPEQTFQSTLNNLLAEHGSEELFFQHLQQNNLLPGDYLIALENDLKIETILARIAFSAEPVSPEEIEAYYRNHQASFSLPEQRSVRHILISTENNYSHLPHDSHRRRTLALYARLQRNPQSFATEALLHSDCTTSIDGGDLGRISPGELCTPLDQALFQLKEGEVSPIIKTKRGFHLLYCEKIHPGQFQNLEEASPRIQQLLTRKKRILACRNWLQSLLSSFQ